MKQDDLTVSEKDGNNSNGNNSNKDFIEKYFEKKPEISFGDKLNLYKLKSEFFIPHLFIPENVISSDYLVDEITEIVSLESYDSSSVLFVKNQNIARSSQLTKIEKFCNNKKTSLIFKKNNPTKYRLYIHNAAGVFPIVFLENYNQHWKVFLVDAAGIKNQHKNKKMNRFWETWFQRSIDNNENHLIVNGYANSWVIDVDNICRNTSSKCIKNSNGSYDMELIVEFRPQRLFYIGSTISGTTLLACLFYLGYDYKRTRKKKLLEKSTDEN